MFLQSRLVKRRSRSLADVRSGLSILEVVIAMTIFALLATATIKGVLWIQERSEYVKYNNLVQTAIENYAAQIKGCEFNYVRGLATAYSNGEEDVEIDTSNLAAFVQAASDSDEESTEGSEEEPDLEEQMQDALSVGDWTEKEILVRLEEGDTGLSANRFLKLRIKLDLSDGQSAAITQEDRRKYIIARLSYEWTPPPGSYLRKTKSGTYEFLIVDQNFAPTSLI